MSKKKALTVFKKNGQVQREDIALTKEVAVALRNRALEGKTLYPKTGSIHIQVIGEDGKEMAQTLSVGTYRAWIVRGNVIPETGMTLREFMDMAREEYRNRKAEERRTMMLDEAESVFHRNLRIRTNLPVIGLFGVVKDEDGKVVRKENAKLLKIKTDTAMFISERLNPQKYGKVEKTENKHLVFSLADLRRAKEGQRQEA